MLRIVCLCNTSVTYVGIAFPQLFEWASDNCEGSAMVKSQKTKTAGQKKRQITSRNAGRASTQKPKSALEAELNKNEQLLWSYRPDAFTFALAHVRAAAMGMPFIMTAMLWQGMVMKATAVPHFGVLTWLFAGVGVAYLCVPLIAYVQGKVYVFYALTDKRLMILSLFPKHRVQSFPISSVRRVFIKDVHCGTGTLMIDAPGAVPKNPTKLRAGFYGVPYVARIEDAFNMLKNPHATHGASTCGDQAYTQQAVNDKSETLVPSSSLASTPSARSETVSHSQCRGIGA